MARGKSVIPDERIIKKIVLLRNEKVILDLHLADSYEVETRTLKQAVKRNLDRFPEDFMFELSDEEIEEVVSQNVIPHKKYLGGAKPFAFTETGVAMLSSVLKSKTAIQMNLTIIRTFVTIRKIAVNHVEIMHLLKEMRMQYDSQFEKVFNALENLINPPELPRRRIGFRRPNEPEDDEV
jgi:hypothetical protein